VLTRFKGTDETNASVTLSTSNGENSGTYGDFAFFLPYATCALTQNTPVLPSHPRHSIEEQRVEAYASNFHDSRFNIDPARTYSLAELIDLAEAQNPETRVAWERARAQAAALGVARSEVYPTVAAAALSETDRSNVLFGNEFFPQNRRRHQP